MINVKLLAGFAAFGALVSVLAGIIGGNPFGIILLRMLASSLIFLGFGLGVNFVVKRYFPDLVPAPGKKEPEAGEEVDIVIDEDISFEVESLLPENGSLSTDREPLEAADETQDELQGEELVEEAEEVLSDELYEEPQLASEAAGAGSAEIEEQPPYRSEAQRVSVDAGFDALDALPDIDQLTFSSEADSPPKPTRSIKNEQVDQVVRDQDPADLAKAVRTFLKKDQ